MLEGYLFDHCFDKDGILYAYHDAVTGRPFTRKYMSTQYLDMLHVPDPVNYWSNEDSVQYTGYLLPALYEQYMATRDSRVVDQMNTVYQGVRKLFMYSQTLDPDSFSRPYGGLDNMAKYREPLGADQAQSLFWGLWLFRQFADQRMQAELDEMNLRTLEWYRRQDYSYLYYKLHVHGSRGESMRGGGHSVCYFMPAAIWAYTYSKDRSYYEDYMRLFEEQWFEIAWKHRPNIRWLKEMVLVKDKEFWQRFQDRCTTMDISSFQGKEPARLTTPTHPICGCWLQSRRMAFHTNGQERETRTSAPALRARRENGLRSGVRHRRRRRKRCGNRRSGPGNGFLGRSGTCIGIARRCLRWRT